MTTQADQLALAEKEWKPIPRVSRVIPFGYEVDPEDEDILLPIPLELEALEKAKKHIKNFSYREVAQWLTAVTGRPISHVGLKKRIEVERTRKSRIGALKGWAARYEKTAQKIAKLEEERTGAKT